MRSSSSPSARPVAGLRGANRRRRRRRGRRRVRRPHPDPRRQRHPRVLRRSLRSRARRSHCRRVGSTPATSARSIDGELVVTGRAKEILFVAGQNHYPQDIEARARAACGHRARPRGRRGRARRRHAATDDVVVFVCTRATSSTAFAQAAQQPCAAWSTSRLGLPVTRRRPGAPVSQDDQRQDPALRAGARRTRTGEFADVLAELAHYEAGTSSCGRRRCGDLEQTLLAICQAALPDRKLSRRRQPVRDRHRAR